MRSGSGASCPAKRNFTGRLMERVRVGASELFLGAMVRQARVTAILILSSGILHQRDRIQKGRARLAFTIWWATGGNGRERNLSLFPDLWRCPFTPAIPRISSMANTM